jgi:hypothetical protein
MTQIESKTKSKRKRDNKKKRERENLRKKTKNIIAEVSVNKAFGGITASDRIGGQILIVGEGNFSLTLSLCKAKLKSDVFENLWSTTLDSYLEKKNQIRNNGEIARNIAKIQELSWAHIFYKIDGTKLFDATELQESVKNCCLRRLTNLERCKPCSETMMKQPLFDVIFFTFPIQYPILNPPVPNNRLILDFFASATTTLRDNGEIRIALHANQYLEWKVGNSAISCGLKLSQTSVCHCESLFKTTDGYGSEWIPADPKWYDFVKLIDPANLAMSSDLVKRKSKDPDSQVSKKARKISNF